MEFLSSPIHNYSYETFDDAFFELPKEMDFELNSDFRDGSSYSMHEEEDLNDGMYGVWNAKHPWSLNNNANSLYNSNLHLDFIGGDPESAMMVNPNVVIPNGFCVGVRHEDDSSLSEGQSSSSQSTHVPDQVTMKTENAATEFSDGEEEVTNEVKKIKHRLLSTKESLASSADCSATAGKSSSPKNTIRILKPAVVESNDSPLLNGLTSPQNKNEGPRLKTLTIKNGHSVNSKCGLFYQNEHFYPKPAFSYSCLIAMALKNSKHGCLPVAEIYNFMCNHFPYFKTAPNGWKNSVRHNLSLNKCFEKIEKPAGSTQRKGCLWALNPSKAAKLEEEVLKCAKKDVLSIKKAMEYPEHLELLERGELKSLYDSEQGTYEDEEDMDTNEDDTEGEEPEANEVVDDRLSESEEQHERTPAMNISKPRGLPEFKIEVDDSIYDELMGTIKQKQLFSVNGSPSNTTNERTANAVKKVKKIYIQVNNGAEEKATIKPKSAEAFDHYDINNFLRLENEMKLTTGKRTPPRFTKQLVPNSRIKQIKFKTWD
ncbi:hypothetical protein V9T40_005835 [Parthenolecanium corni]|uniref:Fork-head domain-containing protein n=1 Tax=Parthenolecanium corni TaxID=536013 RepID=A0AAN9U2H1_9HEMI